jgi:hypothetical protein
MSDTASSTFDPTEGIGRVLVNGIVVATVGGPSARSRATTAAAALNAAFAAGDDFEFCTPSWYSDDAPYALITVKSASIADPDTWYASDKRFIVAATSDESAYPWWTVLRWAQNVRKAVAGKRSSLYAPPGYGTSADGPVLDVKGSNYGCGEALNKGTANLEVFHCCDLSASITASVYEVPDRTSRWVRMKYASTGKTVVLRVNDVGPAAWTGRTIDLTCRGSTKALGTYRTDSPISIQFRK